MDQETIKGLIQKYKLQVESLSATIRTLEAELGQQHPGSLQGGQEQTTDGQSNGGKPKPPSSGADPLSVVREWQFFNKSQPEAAEQLLEAVNHPLGIGVLVDGLEKGGLKIGGKAVAEKRQNLATVLARSSGRFGRAARGTWGLASWPHITPVKRGDEAESSEDGGDKTAAPAGD